MYKFVSANLNEVCSIDPIAPNKCEISGAECKDNFCTCKADYTENADVTNCEQS